MNALYRSIYNFISLLVLEKDRVCACTCGRHQVYHVVPHNEAPTMVDSQINLFSSDKMTQQKAHVVFGLLLGLCISWLLLWLERVWHSGLKYWICNRINDVGFWSWMPKFSNTRDFLRRLHPNHTQDSRGTNVHINPYVNGTNTFDT